MFYNFNLPPLVAESQISAQISITKTFMLSNKIHARFFIHLNVFFQCFSPAVEQTVG
jgi:hypothetical protein